MAYIVGAAYLSGFFLIFFSVVDAVMPHRSVLSDQLRFYDNAWTAAHGNSSPDEQALNWLQRPKAALTALAQRRGLSDVVAVYLEKAGVRVDAKEFVFFHTLGVVITGLAGFLVAGSGLAALGVIAGVCSPLIWLRFRAGRRRKQLEAQLPEMLSMVVASLRAGYGLTQAVDSVTKEMAAPIAEELNKVMGESKLGLTVEHAFQNMAARVKIDGFDWLVMVIKVQRDVGGNLAEVLETLADTLRDRDRISRQIKVLTAEGRLSASILLALPLVISIALYFINPEYLLLLVSTLPGFVMLSTALLLMSVGAVWLLKIVNIRV